MPTREQAITVLKTCKDPEINLDVWTLGLIYDLQIKGDVMQVKMTLTTPFCPYADALVGEVRDKLAGLKGVRDVKIEVVFEPPWQPSEELKAQMGLA